MRRVSIGLLPLLALGVAKDGLGDGPGDNIPDKVRPVPPPGVELGETDRKALENELGALAQEITRLKKRAALAAPVADVEIFYRAVAGAFMYGELFAPADVTAARALLQAGRERAAALGQGQAPWLGKIGPTALGYVSRLDGSVQPYGLHLPATFAPGSAARWRLDTWFHGRNEKLSEVNFLAGVLKSGGPFVRPDAFVLQPYGRYCNAAKLAGEVDFFEALEDVKRRFRVDEDRIVIRGFSMGGASAWHLGAHHAGLWAAVAPGAGFSETPEFLKVFQNETLSPTWWEQKLWQLYDAPVYAENFRNVPVVAYSGELDRQKQAADVMDKALAGIGLDLVHVIGPRTGHQYHPESIVKINEIVDALARRGRDPLPRRVSLVTPTLAYNRQAWLAIEGLAEHWTKASVEGEIVGSAEVRLATRGVTALAIEMPPGLGPFFPGRPPAVVIDGQRLAGTAPASDRSWSARFHRAGARWAAGDPPGDAAALRKRPGLQGPIDDAFLSSFLMVTPSGRAFASKLQPWVYEEQQRAIKEWRRQMRGEPRVKLDQYVSADDIANHNLVLWGDPGSNRLLSSIAEQLPIRWSREGIAAGKESYAPDKHVLLLVYPNPLNPKKYVVLNSGFTYREYDYLNNARQTPKLPDWAVVDITQPPNSRTPGKIVNADFFDERWQLKPARKAPAGPRTPAVAATKPAAASPSP
jgi:predicted esterase